MLEIKNPAQLGSTRLICRLTRLSVKTFLLQFDDSTCHRTCKDRFLEKVTHLHQYLSSIKLVHLNILWILQLASEIKLAKMSFVCHLSNPLETSEIVQDQKKHHHFHMLKIYLITFSPIKPQYRIIEALVNKLKLFKYYQAYRTQN